MTQPYIYDETSTFIYDESPSFQYPENFLPFDAGYHEDQPIGPAWPSTNEHAASSMPPFYEQISFPIEQAHLQSTTSQAPVPQQDLNPVSVGPYGPVYGYPIAFEASRVLPYYPKSSVHQIHTVEYSPVSDADSVPSLPPKRPVIALEWRNNDSVPCQKETSNPAKKRKVKAIAPALKPSGQDGKATAPCDSQQLSGLRSLEDCMGLFDNTLTATKEKRRRKVFSAQEKKVVRSVRMVGACIQCKFRKKTCSAGNPCPYCARLAGTLGTQICQRESPFIERSMMLYYPSTSRKRILDFHLSTTELEGSQQLLYIDGAGPVTRPLCLKIIEIKTQKLDLSDKARVLQTIEPEKRIPQDAQSLSEVIRVLKPASLSRMDLENWAVDYTHKYSSTMLPHATGFIFGVEYAKKGLPHSDIVNKITRLVSINFVLRAGVTILSGSPSGTQVSPSPYRTIQAQIDTLLFESFEANEKSLSRDLQRLIFRSAGSLARDAIVPVCLCVLQLARLQCMLASQLTNLAAYDLKRNRRPNAHISASERGPSSASSAGNPNQANTHSVRQFEAENLTHGLNLLLCTFEALYRNACPLLLDWNDPFSKDLLNNDEELLALASKMGRTLRGYRNKGHSRKFRLGFGYDKEMSGRIRGLLRER